MRYLRTITPYHNTIELSRADLCWSGRRHALSLYDWLASAPQAPGALRNDARGGKQAPEPRSPRASRLTAVSLQLRDVDALLQAAATRGYAPIHSGVPQFAWLQRESG